MGDGPAVFVVAGEASGDMHGAGLVRAMRRRRPDTSFSGIGGSMMKEAGVSLIFPNSDLAVVGLVEIVSHAASIVRAFKKTVRWLADNRPSLLILIDYPEFNMLLAARAVKLGIPVMYFISPQIWAWRQGRVHKLKKLVDRMVVILPFEEEFYSRFGMKVDFVGHPLVDTVRAETDRDAFCSALGLDTGRPLVSLLPGSRGGEIERLLPLLRDAADIVHKAEPDVQFVLPVAPGLGPESLSMLEGAVADLQSSGVCVQIVAGMTWDAINASDMAVAASGTVTLEAAILGTPSVVVYRLAPLSYHIGRLLVRVRYASLVNLVADREILPELIQNDATPVRLARVVRELLADRERYGKLVRDMSGAVGKLGPPGALDRAAEIACGFLKAG